jgi:hypothetical protein
MIGKILKPILIAASLTLVLAVFASPASAEDYPSCAGTSVPDHATNHDTQAVQNTFSPYTDPSGGLPFGAFVSAWTQVHADSHHPGCSDAAEDVIFELTGIVVDL